MNHYFHLSFMKMPFLFFFILLTGCTAWQSKVDPDAIRYDQLRQNLNKSEKKVSLVISAEHVRAGGVNVHYRQEKYESEALKRFNASSLFSKVDINSDEYDLKIILNIIEEEDFNTALTVVSALTVFLIPTFDKITTRCSGEIIDSAGNKVGSISTQDETTVMFQLFAFPFVYKVIAAEEQVRENLFNSVLTQIIENDEIWK